MTSFSSVMARSVIAVMSDIHPIFDVVLKPLALIFFSSPQWPSSQHVWYLITGCYHCVGSTPTWGYADDLSEYNLGF